MTTALIVTDMLNRYEHEDAGPLLESVQAIVPRLRELIAEARDRKLLVAYVNDNHGDWTAGRDELADRAMGGAAPALVEPLLPLPDLPFIVKARHSAFYGTQLEYMLRQHEVTRLVLAGQVTEQCILYSALDAYVRHFEVVVPCDAVAHIHADLADAALKMMRINMRAHTPSCDEALDVALHAASR
ncbi:MAG TPA: isochorismatase family cysteine hydrolase [Solirubrobacteraceae bacterium]|jgi:nicotinamidase-related amidase|nr:isochorismatase family cysteine hydrolase [Solirubrobacteraceae bacterium]